MLVSYFLLFLIFFRQCVQCQRFSRKPSGAPTGQPTSMPTKYPSAQPTRTPSLQQSRQPTLPPTKIPTPRPTPRPSPSPSNRPLSPVVVIQPTSFPTSMTLTLVTFSGTTTLAGINVTSMNQVGVQASFVSSLLQFMDGIRNDQLSISSVVSPQTHYVRHGLVSLTSLPSASVLWTCQYYCQQLSTEDPKTSYSELNINLALAVSTGTFIAALAQSSPIFNGVTVKSMSLTPFSAQVIKTASPTHKPSPKPSTSYLSLDGAANLYISTNFTVAGFTLFVLGSICCYGFVGFILAIYYNVWQSSAQDEDEDDGERRESPSRGKSFNNSRRSPGRSSPTLLGISPVRTRDSYDNSSRYRGAQKSRYSEVDEQDEETAYEDDYAADFSDSTTRRKKNASGFDIDRSVDSRGRAATPRGYNKKSDLLSMPSSAGRTRRNEKGMESSRRSRSPPRGSRGSSSHATMEKSQGNGKFASPRMEDIYPDTYDEHATMSDRPRPRRQDEL